MNQQYLIPEDLSLTILLYLPLKSIISLYLTEKKTVFTNNVILELFKRYILSPCLSTVTFKSFNMQTRYYKPNRRLKSSNKLEVIITAIVNGANSIFESMGNIGSYTLSRDKFRAIGKYMFEHIFQDSMYSKYHLCSEEDKKMINRDASFILSQRALEFGLLEEYYSIINDYPHNKDEDKIIVFSCGDIDIIKHIYPVKEYSESKLDQLIVNSPCSYNIDVVKYIISLGANANANHSHSLSNSIGRDQYEITDYLISQGANIEENISNNTVNQNFSISNGYCNYLEYKGFSYKDAMDIVEKSIF